MYSASTLLPFNSDAKNAISQQRKKIPNLIPSSLQPNSNSIYRKQNAPRLEISKTPPEKLSIRVSSDVLIDESAITYAKNFETTSSVGDATAMNIQAVWSLFSRLNDQDRNDLLKGLLANCDSLQVECICQELNLKLSSTNGVGALHLHPLSSHAKINRTTFNRSQLPISVLRPVVNEINSNLQTSKLRDSTTNQVPALLSVSPTNVSPLTSPKKNPVLPIPNANMYLKLFSNSEVQKEPSSCHKDVVLKLHEFAARRCQKLEKTIDAINTAASSLNLEKALVILMQCLQQLLYAGQYTLYIFSSTPFSIRVASSNWLPIGHQVPSTEYIFGYSTLIDGGCLNVFHALTSEYFTNMCHEFYPDNTLCFLSVPILSESGSVLAIIEFMNKTLSSDVSSAPFFDIEDEFVLVSTLPTWRLLLKEAKAEESIKSTTALLREVLQWLHQMLTKHAEDDIQKIVEECVSRLLSAEKATLSLDLAQEHLPSEIKEKLKLGEPLLVAHALTLPEFRQLDIRNLIAIPIKISESYGAIYAKNKLPSIEYFNQEDMLNLSTLTPLLSSILKNAFEQSHIHKKLNFLEDGLQYMKNIFSSQEQIVISCTQKLDIIRVDLGCTLFEPLFSNPATYLPMRIPRSNEVFYYDLESCIQTQKPKSNSEYPFKYENEAQFIDYSMNPVNDMILIWIRPSSSSLRTARFYSTFFNESKNLQSLYHSSRETSHLLTLLFVNIDSFRKWAQTLKDGILTQFLQTFYSVIQTEVQKLGGMVTSIQSDRVLCAFGLPVPSDDDAEKAIQCSLSLLDSLKVFFSQFQESQHLVEINLAARVTLTTGHAVASLCEFGNRVHYALVGDPVNLVSNLETVAHNYSSRLLLHKSTEQAAKQKYEFREIDLAMIPNTLEPSYVYDVVGLINVIADNDIRTCVICYELGLGEYRQRNFDAALTYFRKCKSLVDDGPSTLMIKRCQKACDNIQLVPFEWDGVWKWD